MKPLFATSRLRPVMLTLLALALAVRALVPAGWMPTSGKGFTITICTGTTMQSMWMDAKGKLHKADPSKKHKGSMGEECLFASLATPTLPVLTLDTAIPVHIAESQISAVIPEVTIGRGLAAPPPPATGPPLLA